MRTKLLILLFLPVLCFGQEVYKVGKTDTLTYSPGGVYKIGGVVYADSYTWDDEFLAYETGLETALSSDTRTKINDFIIAIKDSLGIDSLNQYFDVLYVLANETSEAALRNLVKRSHDATISGTPTFTAFSGFKGNGSDAYLNTNYNQNGSPVVYTQNAGAIGHYQTTTIDSLAQVPMWGAYDGVSPYRGSFNVVNVSTGDLNFTSYASVNTARYNSSRVFTNYSNGGSSIGMHIINRTNSTTENYYFNKVASTAHTLTAQTFFNGNIYLLARNNGAAAELHNKNELALWFIGKTLSDDEINDITDIFNDYLGLYYPIVAQADYSTIDTLTLVTYDGSGETVHPSIIDVGEEWGGYRYWMANTPYPESDPAFENPCVWASADGETWVVPDGLTNPIYAKPASDFNADSEIFYDTEQDSMYVIWKEKSTGNVLMLSSGDGVTWAGKRTVLDAEANEKECISPSLIKIGSKYYIYYFTFTDILINNPRIMRVSSNSINGLYGNRELITAPTNDGFIFWHFDILYYDGYYWLSSLEASGTGRGLDIYIMKSSDGINFSQTQPAFRAARKEVYDLAIRGFYKPSLVIIANQPTLYVTTWYSTTTEWRLAKVNVNLY